MEGGGWISYLDVNTLYIRPISLLPHFLKILKKLFYARLEKCIDKHQLVTDRQYGFTSKRSTALAITEAIKEISNSKDNKKNMLLVSFFI